MMNNLELIKPLLNFEKEGDFYMCYIFLRKKDQLDGEKDNHQSVRTIKTYCIDSFEYLDKRWDEITYLCEYFKARAYIHVQKQNHKDVGLNMMVELAKRIQNKVFKFNNLFDSVVGQLKVYEKRWIVDLDTKDEEYKNIVINAINNVQPYYNYSKIITEIPTKQGVHLITTPFNVEKFKKELTSIVYVIPDIQKKNPTLLFLPKSLE